MDDRILPMREPWWRDTPLITRTHPGSLRAAAEVALRSMFLVLIACDLVAMVPPMVRLLSTPTGVEVVAVTLIVVMHAVIGRCVACTQESVRSAVAVCVLASVAVLLVGSVPWQGHNLQERAIHLWLMTATVYCVVSTTRVAWRIGLAAILLAVSLLTRLSHHDEALARGQDLYSTIYLIALMATAAFILDMVRRAAVTGDARREGSRRTALAEAAAHGRKRELHELERLLHDEVLSALRVIMNHRGESPLDDSEREYCRQALALFAEHPDTDATSTSLTEALQSVVRESGLDVACHLDHVVVPQHVVTALSRATSEALRNVERHSGTHRCAVDLTQRAGNVEVLITDDGVGFDPDDLGGRSMGVSRSVTERVHDSGGSVEVQSAPGTGARVTLRWKPRIALVDNGPRIDLGRSLAPSALPFVLSAVPFALVMTWFTPHPVVGLLASAILTVTGVLTFGELWRTGRSGLPTSMLRVVVALGCLLVTIFLLFPPGIIPHPNFYWMAGAVNALVMLTIFARRLVEGVVAGVALLTGSILLIANRYGLMVAFDNFLGLWVNSVNAVVGALVLRITMGTLVSRNQESARIDLASELRRAESEAGADVAHRGLVRVRRRVSGLLSAGAAGRPIGMSERTTAGALEAEVRDELLLLGDLDSGLRSLLYRARLAGWAVDLREATQGAAAGMRQILQVLAGLPGASGRVVFSLRGATVVGVVVNPADAVRQALEQLADDPGVSVHEDDEFVRVDVRPPTVPV